MVKWCAFAIPLARAISLEPANEQDSQANTADEPESYVWEHANTDRIQSIDDFAEAVSIFSKEDRQRDHVPPARPIEQPDLLGAESDVKSLFRLALEVRGEPVVEGEVIQL